MNTIVNENHISFKEFEQKIFQYICELGCDLTKTMLERYDEELAEERDKKAYRNKGLRKTTIKTVYGEVCYSRRVYETKLEDEIQQRILNGDGGSWIKDPYDPEVIFQLDRFHVYQEIKRKIRDQKAEQAIVELFKEKKIEEMLEYITQYADSVASDKRSSNARKLYE